jgi:hypothetical protein
VVVLCLRRYLISTYLYLFLSTLFFSRLYHCNKIQTIEQNIGMLLPMEKLHCILFFSDPIFILHLQYGSNSYKSSFVGHNGDFYDFYLTIHLII